VLFFHFPQPWTAEGYQRLATESGADFFVLSGWLKLVTGLDPTTNFNSCTVINIHPGPLPEFGGPGLYGHHVHEAVMAAYRRGEISHTAVSMHFVTEEYDRGPKFFEHKIEINDDDTPESLDARVNAAEHRYQPEITNMVVNGLIKWNGIDLNSLKVPKGY
jgi:phosphoribosylglycinamide formyltransferase-1